LYLNGEYLAGNIAKKRGKLVAGNIAKKKGLDIVNIFLAGDGRRQRLARREAGGDQQRGRHGRRRGLDDHRNAALR
jgi:hypothetical protein